MGPRMVTLEADWIDKGKMEVNGETGSFTQVYPNGPTTFTDEEIIKFID